MGQATTSRRMGNVLYPPAWSSVSTQCFFGSIKFSLKSDHSHQVPSARYYWRNTTSSTATRRTHTRRRLTRLSQNRSVSPRRRAFSIGCTDSITNLVQSPERSDIPSHTSRTWIRRNYRGMICPLFLCSKNVRLGAQTMLDRHMSRKMARCGPWFRTLRITGTPGRGS